MNRAERALDTQWEKATGGTFYRRFMEAEGVPIYEALGGVGDVAELPRRPWARMGGSGTFLNLLGFAQSGRGVYIVEIPGGGALNPEKHMYEEAIFILGGRGLTEVWYEGQDKVTFEWGEGSIFSPPLNTWHRLVNGSREPALLVGVTTAPKMMNMVFDNDFIFNCDFVFKDRFGGQADFFTAGENRYTYGSYGLGIWETNFIPDARAAFLDDFEQKVAGGQLTGYRMGKYGPNGHISEWPVGIYTKAHYHGPGAFLMGLEGKGYVLVWPSHLGPHPYQDGHADQVTMVEWGPRSIYSPFGNAYHQHFNTSGVPARHIAIYGWSERFEKRKKAGGREEDYEALVSDREGGTLLEYEDEDPEVRRYFEEALKKEGVESKMPPVTYRQ